MLGLAQSLVFTPFVTMHALTRMTQEANLNQTDHVLLEWWLAFTLYSIPGYPVYRIMPIFCGSVSLL